MIGKVCFPEWWNRIEKRKQEHEAEKSETQPRKIRESSSAGSILGKPLFAHLHAVLAKQANESCKDFLLAWNKKDDSSVSRYLEKSPPFYSYDVSPIKEASLL